MPGKLQHTLLNLEIPPPAEAWPAIAARLAAEYATVETTISDKLYDWEMTPPPGAWAAIATGIAAEEPVKKTGILISPFRKAVIAAAIVALVVFTSWYFLFSNATATSNLVQEEKQLPVIDDRDVDAKNNTTNLQPSLPVHDRPVPRRSLNRLAQYNQLAVNSMPVAGYNYDYPDNIRHSDLTDIQVINTTKTPDVEAPLIRDANGEIILDRNLIASADNNYIIVTAPNGEQTRISARFLQMLGAMNTDLKPSDYFDYFIMGENSSGWKIRFNEWRNKILQQSSFVPSATNFLDILELKDLFEDK